MSCNVGIFKPQILLHYSPGGLFQRGDVQLILVTIFSHSSCGYCYGSLSTQMVTFKLIKHKDRHHLCPTHLPTEIRQLLG